MKLSILIPTMPDRQAVFCDLYRRLMRQITPEVEVIADCNSETGISQKRNSLLRSAKGDYTVWLDDDDLVADDYIVEVLRAIESGPDCVGYWLEYKDQWGVKRAMHSHSVDKWRTLASHFERCISFLNPVKRSILLDVPFDESKDYAEDHDHSMRLKTRLKTEVFIDKIMYYYFPQASRELGQ